MAASRASRETKSLTTSAPQLIAIRASELIAIHNDLLVLYNPELAKKEPNKLKKAAELIYTASDMLERSEYDIAMRLLSEAETMCSRLDPTTLELKANIFICIEQYDDAITCVATSIAHSEEMISKLPILQYKLADSYFLLATLFFKKQRYQTALDFLYYAMSIDNHVLETDLSHQMTIIMFIECHIALAKQNPELVEYTNSYLSSLNNDKQIKSYLQTSNSIKKFTQSAYDSLKHRYFNVAKSSFDKLILLQPDNFEFWAERGWANYKGKGNKVAKDSLKDFNFVIWANPNNPELLERCKNGRKICAQFAEDQSSSIKISISLLQYPKQEDDFFCAGYNDGQDHSDEESGAKKKKKKKKKKNLAKLSEVKSDAPESTKITEEAQSPITSAQDNSKVAHPDSGEEKAYDIKTTYDAKKMSALTQVAVDCIKLLNTSGKKSYAVGGAPRSMLTNDPVTDVDIVTWVDEQTLLDTLKEKGIFKNQFVPGLFCLKLNNMKVDIVITESNNLLDNANQRDFTINAIYADENGNIFDPIGKGCNDLRLKIIDTTYSADQSFQDDPIRILRAIYFATKLMFTLSDAIKTAAEKHCNLLLKKAIPGQVNSWLCKLLSQPEKASDSFNLLINLNIFSILFPEIAAKLQKNYDRLKYIIKVENNNTKPSLTGLYDQMIGLMSPADDQERKKIIDGNVLFSTNYSFFKRNPVSFFASKKPVDMQLQQKSHAMQFSI